MSRVRALRSGGEDGYIMVVVLFTLVIALALGAAGLAESLDSRALSFREGRVHRAQQGADAGIQQELFQQAENRIGQSANQYNLNAGLLNQGTFLDCMVPSFSVSGQVSGLATAAVGSAGTCPTNSGPGNTIATALGNDTWTTSEFIPGAQNPLAGGSETDLYPKIVSLAWNGPQTPSTSNSVFSREEAILAPIFPMPVLHANHDATIQGVSLSGGILSSVLSAFGIANLATTIQGDLHVVHDLTLPAADVGINLTLSNGLLGDVQYGHKLLPASPAPIVAAQQVNTAPPYRQPLTVSSTKAYCPSPDSNGASGCSDFPVNVYNASTHFVTVAAGQTLTLYGGDYVFCNFTVASGGTVIASPTAAMPVRIFIDSPNSGRCAGNSGPQGSFTAPGGIVNNEGTTTPSGLQIYVAGDDTATPFDNSTSVTIGTAGAGSNGGLQTGNPAVESMLLYAPTSSVSVTTATCKSVVLVGIVCLPGVFAGSIVGNDVSVAALTLTQDLDLGNDPLYNGANAYRVLQYVQCSPQPFKTQSGGTTTYTALQHDSTIDTNGC